ncbi:F-box protein SKIP23-like [Pyrus ussuriensis x Pyrus communis]|uniref:F-box protein SKIP23-like n=1 Tax=Pyrus ussuriensis x Pyrus communis TaxID=2448454 RepID=A0A5N5F6L2_9ROSA|nr:F-box protein SKIP23-like [Pyrus ussuriensis x Pyrus communis]
MGPDWANLPTEVVGLISERLTLDRDYFLFGMVCKSWHRKTKNNAIRISTMSTRHRAPMLLFSTGNNGVWRLYDVMRDKVLDLQVKLSKKRFCGSSKGWLVAVEEDFTITLINPVFRVKGRKVKENSIICLPPFNPPSWERVWIGRPNYGVYKATITADPILDADNCVVLVIYEDRCQLAFIRLNKDKMWTYIEDLRFVLFEVVPVRNQFYAIGGDESQLLSFDITTRFSSDIKFITTRRANECFTTLYLVSVNEEELLMVVRYIDHDYDREKRVTEKFEIFKSLGDVALFLGDNSTVAVLASDIPGCRSNCIYFTHDHDRQTTIEFGGRGPHDLGVYDLESRIVDSQRPFTFSKLAMKMVGNSIRPPIWIVPTFQYL